MPSDNPNRPAADSPKSGAVARLSDSEIMCEIQAGNPDAFAILFERFHRLVLVTAVRIVRDVAEAEEVTQGVFLELYRCAKQYDAARGSLKVWILQFAYHRSINRRNYLTLRRFYDRVDLDQADSWDPQGSVIPQYASQEAAQLIQEVLHLLNEPQRRTIRFVFFEGMTLKEVSERTGESFSNVRNHYYRGLERLRCALAARSGVIRADSMAAIREVDRAKA